MAEHVCLGWVGDLIASPLRKLFYNPTTILTPHIRAGMTVLDVGCALGYFSLPMAKLVGPTGRVCAVALQPDTLDVLCRRARRARVLKRIEPRLCGGQSLHIGDLDGHIDFALAFGVTHEMPYKANFFAEVRAAMKPGARLLLAEPKGHVSAGAFQQTLALAKREGFDTVQSPAIRWSHAMVLARG